MGNPLELLQSIRMLMTWCRNFTLTSERLPESTRACQRCLNRRQSLSCSLSTWLVHMSHRVPLMTCSGNLKMVKTWENLLSRCEIRAEIGAVTPGVGAEAEIGA